LTIFFSIIAIIYSLSLPNLYKSNAILAPVEQTSVAQPSQVFGGLAAIAGINDIRPVSSKELEAIEKIQSLSFFAENIMPNIFLPDLMAIKSWDPDSNTIEYEDDKYNKVSQRWVRKFNYPKKQIPSAQESYKQFIKIMDVKKDEENDFLNISVKHQSPYIAEAWTRLIVDEINELYKTNDRLESEAAINYLNLQIAQTSYTEIRLVIANLLEQKMQQMALIEANRFYLFSYIDPPTVMEEKFSPKRSSISILGAVFGFMLGVLMVLVINFFKKRS